MIGIENSAVTEHETGTSHLAAHTVDGLLVLALNRPEARNALSTEMPQALRAQLLRSELHDAVRCVVLTGTGGSFCAGGDVNMMAKARDQGSRDIDAIINRQRVAQRGTAGALFSLFKPTVAAINGAAAGAGLALGHVDKG